MNESGLTRQQYDINNRQLSPFALASLCMLAALAVTILFLFPINSMDIWWHLDSGRWMLEHHQYLGEEVRSYSINGAEWHNFSWLFQVVVALLEQWTGLWGLLIFKAILLWLTFTLLFLSIGSRGAPFGGLLAFVLLAWMIIPHVYLRPHLVEGVFLALVIYWVQREPRREDIWRYALLILVWANVHASVVVGVAALSLHYLVGTDFKWPGKARLLKGIPLVTLLAALAFASPNGLDLIDVLIGHADAEFIHTYIREWRVPEALPAVVWPVVGALLVAAFLKLRLIRPAELFLIAFFLFYSIGSKRFLFELGLVLVRPVGVLAGAMLSRAGENFPRLAGRHGWVLGTILLVGILLTHELPLAWKHVDRKDYPSARGAYPHVAMSVLAPVLEGEKELRMWTAYGWGGYVGWKGNGHLKIYIDGRTPTVFDERMLVKTNLSYGRPNMLRYMAEKWDVAAILLHRSDRLPFAANDPQWRIAAYDDGSVLYLRDDLARRYDIEPIGFEPFMPIGRVDASRLPDYVRQVQKILASDPQNSLAWLHLGEYLAQAWMIYPDEKGAIMAQRAYERAIEEATNPVQAQIRLAWWLSLRKRPGEEVVQQLLPAIWETPEAQRSLFAVPLAKLFLKTGHPQEALRALTYETAEIQRHLNQSFQVWLLRLQAYLDLGDEPSAARINDIVLLMSLDAPPALSKRYRKMIASNPDIFAGQQKEAAIINNGDQYDLQE